MMDKQGSTSGFKRRLALPRRAGLSAGVVLGFTSLTIVIARSFSEKDYEIISWEKEGYGDGITRKSPEFPRVLKTILNRHLKNHKTIRIWCMIQSKGVETRFLVLPDMAARNLPQAVFWSFKKEVELESHDMVFDFDVTGERRTGDKLEREVMACSAPAGELQELKALFKRSGWPLTGVTVTSFAFQNLFRTGFAGEGSRNIATLFIGADWSRIDIFSNGNLILSRDIKTGTRSMTEVIDEHVKKQESEGISIDAYLDQDDPLDYQEEGSVEKRADAVAMPVQANHFFDMIHDGESRDLDEVFELIHPVVDRLIRQIERTFEHFSMTCKGQAVERLYFTGPLCGFKPLLAYTGRQLGIPVSTVDVFKARSGGKGPESVTEQDEYVPSAGLACSHGDYTQNFIHTYKDKNRQRWNRKVSQALLGAMALVVMIGLTLHYGSNAREANLQKDIQRLSRDIKTKEALYGKEGIIEFSKKIKQGKQRVSDLAKSHYGAAVLAEVSRLMPRDIRLISFEYDDGVKASDSGKVTFKGLVFSLERQSLDGFIDRLSSSPLMETVTLTHVREVERGKKKEQYFEAAMELK